MKGKGKSRINLVISSGLVTILAAIFLAAWLNFIAFAALLFAGFILQAIGRESLYDKGYDTGYRDGFGDGKGWSHT